MPKHSETREMPYTADQMFDLIADVKSYPDFLPWCAAARERTRRPLNSQEGAEVLEADLVISFKVFRERFGSRVTLHRSEKTIEVEYLDGPFRYLNNRWAFTDLENGGCRVDFYVDFEFKSIVLQNLIGVVFNQAMQRIVRAFEERAEHLYS